MTGVVAGEEWVCVAVFEFADGSHDPQELHRGSQSECERLARRLEDVAGPRATTIDSHRGGQLDVEAHHRGVVYRGEREAVPSGCVVAAAPASTLEGA